MKPILKWTLIYFVLGGVCFHKALSQEDSDPSRNQTGFLGNVLGTVLETFGKNTGTSNGGNNNTASDTIVLQSHNNTLREINTTSKPSDTKSQMVSSTTESTASAGFPSTENTTPSLYISILGAELFKLKLSEKNSSLPRPTTPSTKSTTSSIGNKTLNFGESIKSYLDLFSTVFTDNTTAPTPLQTKSVETPEVSTTVIPETTTGNTQNSILDKIDFGNIFKDILHENDSSALTNASLTTILTTGVENLAPTTLAPVLNQSDLDGILGGLFNVLYKKPTTTVVAETSNPHDSELPSVTPSNTLNTESSETSIPIGDLLSGAIQQIVKPTDKDMPGNAVPSTTTTTTTSDLSSSVKIVNPQDIKPPLEENQINNILGNIFTDKPLPPTTGSPRQTTELSEVIKNDIVNGIVGQFIEITPPSKLTEGTTVSVNTAQMTESSVSGGRTLKHQSLFVISALLLLLLV